LAQLRALQERNADQIVLRLDVLGTQAGFIECLAIERSVLVGVANDLLKPASLPRLQLSGRNPLLVVKPLERLQRWKEQGDPRDESLRK